MVGGAIHKLDETLTKEDVVLEIGCGGSTLFYGSRCAGVSVIETSPEWGMKVVASVREKGLTNVVYNMIEEEEYIVKLIETSDTSGITVFSVDPQGGYNRSKILNAFLNKGISSNLRMIILDNYAHPGEFPLHHDEILYLGEGWEHFDYNHDRWAGSGTRIYLKTK
jgi:hypothetical protein